MLSESRDFLYVAWWLAPFPGAALALTALGVNLLGDWLRDTSTRSSGSERLDAGAWPPVTSSPTCRG